MVTRNGFASLKISLEVDNESALPRLLEGRVSEHASSDALSVSCHHLFLLILLRPLHFSHFKIKNIAIRGWPFGNDGTDES